MIDTIRFSYLLDDFPSVFLKDFEKFSLISKGKIDYINLDWKNKDVYTSKQKLTSGSYNINYFIDYLQKEITFEFSIPKYLYGNNVEMFPKSIPDDNIHVYVYYELRDFLKFFFKSEFQIRINFEKLIIERIDFCYCYNFTTVENKLNYKNQLPKIFQFKFLKSKTLNYDFNTLMYKTKSHSFKIYDKHIEYERNNKILDTKILEKSKKILRCECTYRNRFFSEIVMNNIDVVNIPLNLKNDIKKTVKTANKINNYLDRLSRLVNKDVKDDIFIKKAKALDKYGELFLKYSTFQVFDFVGRNYKNSSKEDFLFILNSDAVKVLKKFQKYKSIKKLYWKLDFNKRINQSSALIFEELEFSLEFFKILYDDFVNKVVELNNFNMKKVTPAQVLYYKREKIINLIGKRKFNSLLRYIKLTDGLTKYEIVQQSLFSATTVKNYNRLIKDLESKGITLKNIPLSEKITFSNIFYNKNLQN